LTGSVKDFKLYLIITSTVILHKECYRKISKVVHDSIAYAGFGITLNGDME